MPLPGRLRVIFFACTVVIYKWDLVCGLSTILNIERLYREPFHLTSNPEPHQYSVLTLKMWTPPSPLLIILLFLCLVFLYLPSVSQNVSKNKIKSLFTQCIYWLKRFTRLLLIKEKRWLRGIWNLFSLKSLGVSARKIC